MNQFHNTIMSFKIRKLIRVMISTLGGRLLTISQEVFEK